MEDDSSNIDFFQLFQMNDFDPLFEQQDQELCLENSTILPSNIKPEPSDISYAELENLSENLKKSSEEKRLYKAAQKRKARRLRIEKTLQVPDDDFRRMSSKFIFDCFHTSDFNALNIFLMKNALEYLIFRFQSTSSSPGGHQQVILPDNVEIKGIDAIVSFLEAVSRAKPDQIFIISETIIRNNVRACCSISTFTQYGTCVFELLHWRETNDVLDKSNKQQKNDNNNSASSIHSNIVNLTELCGKVDKMSITQLDDRNFAFEKGSRLKSMVPNKGTGTLTVHFLNEEKKIHLIEYKVHYENFP